MKLVLLFYLVFFNTVLNNFENTSFYVSGGGEEGGWGDGRHSGQGGHKYMGMGIHTCSHWQPSITRYIITKNIIPGVKYD